METTPPTRKFGKEIQNVIITPIGTDYDAKSVVDLEAKDQVMYLLVP